MQEKPKRPRIRKEEKLLHIEKWQQGNLSIVDYCRAFNVPVSSMRKWVHAKNKSTQTPSLKPILLKPETSAIIHDCTMEIMVGGRIRILLNNANASVAATIVRELMQCN